MGVWVREWKGTWWMFIRHQIRRPSRRVEPDRAGERAARLLAEQVMTRITLGDMPFPERTHVPTLQRFAERWLQRYLRSRRGPSAWLFPSRHEGPLRPDSFRPHIWNRLLAQAGLTYRGPHALQHTFASALLQNGETVVYVKEQLGYSSIKATVDVYGHMVPGANRQAVDRLPGMSKWQPPWQPNLWWPPGQHETTRKEHT